MRRRPPVSTTWRRPCSRCRMRRGGLDVRLVPGVIDRAGVPDVMRGEEAEILGPRRGRDRGPGLPARHPFQMGRGGGRPDRPVRHLHERRVYGLMRARSILARTMPEDGDHDAHDPAAFARGVARSGAPGGPLHHLFGARTLALTGDLAEGAGPSYLSGLLIGAEIRGRGRPDRSTGSGDARRRRRSDRPLRRRPRAARPPGPPCRPRTPPAAASPGSPGPPAWFDARLV